MGIPDEIDRRIRQDPRLRTVMQKIEAGKADFSDTAHYFYRAADIRGEVLSEHVLEMPPEARTEACEGVLRKCYTDTCETLDGVQGALDDELGISIAPQHPDYPQERVEQVAQSLADPTVPDKTIERRARSATANIAKSFHDAYMKENAGFRSRAGLKCYITRNSGGKCCDWCADLDGRYEYGSEPKDVYARHDNCSCSVTYENGRQRQNVWSKQTWEVPVVGAGAPEPVRYTAETAPKGFVPTVLTGGAKSGTMKIGDMFHTLHDPMREIMGPAYKNNYAELDELIRKLESMGVEVAVSDTNSSMGYQPSPSFSGGTPGLVKMAREASFSAWLHEFQHAMDDESTGWLGRQILTFDPDERYQWEVRAYQVEIDKALELGREDIAERLKKLLEEERRAIYGEIE